MTHSPFAADATAGRRRRVRADRRPDASCSRRASTCCVGPGDDAAVLRVRDGPRGGLHRPARRGPALPPRLGLGATTSATGPRPQNLSDINAMGGRAHSLTVGLAAPARPAGRSGRSTSPTGSPRSARWSAPASSAATSPGRPGGDRGHRARRLRRRRRCCARAPSRATCVALAGRQGWAAGGLAVLGRGFRSPRVLVEAYRRPEPPYDAGPAAADGRRHRDDRRLRRAARRRRPPRRRTPASRSTCDRDAFEIAEPLQAVGAALGADPLQFILGGGDDHALLATFPAGADLPEGWSVIGVGPEAGPRAPASPSTARRTTARRGWTHF